MVNKVVMAYSGGLDTSVAVQWIKNTYNCDVIAMIGNLGQEEELEPVRKKALDTGAKEVYVEDLTEEFVEKYVYPTLKAGAIYEEKYLLGTAIARPVLAKRLCQIAEKEGAEAIAHGCTGKGNDQVRFELAVKSLNPRLKIIAPWREWELKSREDCINYARQSGISIPVSKEKPYSIDGNLWHCSYEGGVLEDPNYEPKEDMFMMTRAPEKAPDEPEYLEIEFKKGLPVKVNGKENAPAKMLKELNEIAGKHGIGRVDMVENRLLGMKSRGVYETPGGTLLYIAKNELEYLTLDKETMHFKEIVKKKYAELVYNGLWFTKLKQSLDAFVDETQENVTGKVRLKLYKGSAIVAGRSSPFSLYNEELATFEDDEVYDHEDAEGFINLYGLSPMNQGLIEKKKEQG